MRLRGIETERQRDRETERQRDRETERQRDRETERQRQTERQRDAERERERETATDREAETDRETGIHYWCREKVRLTVCRHSGQAAAVGFRPQQGPARGALRPALAAPTLAVVPAARAAARRRTAPAAAASTPVVGLALPTPKHSPAGSHACPCAPWRRRSQPESSHRSMALLTASAVPASADPLPDRRLPPLHSLGPPLRLCVRVVCGPAAWHARSHAPAPDSIPPRGASPRGASPPPLASSGSGVSSVKWDRSILVSEIGPSGAEPPHPPVSREFSREFLNECVPAGGL